MQEGARTSGATGDSTPAHAAVLSTGRACAPLRSHRNAETARLLVRGACPNRRAVLPWVYGRRWRGPSWRASGRVASLWALREWKSLECLADAPRARARARVCAGRSELRPEHVGAC